MPTATRIARSIARLLLPDRERERLARLSYRDEGHGYDVFGLHPDWIAASCAVGRFFYETYFRVDSVGAGRIPGEGPAILAANHGGTLPVDAMMLGLDVLRRTDPPRAPRPVLDHFVPRLPFVSTLFARAGAVSGTRANVRRLLEQGELIVLFPEGTEGIGKPFGERYRLQTWTVGHAELAIRHRAPVVPVAIVGAEEQWPELARLRGFHLFGAPYLPIPATPFPLPVHYHIRYGEPLALHDGHGPAAADDPAVLDAAAARVKEAVRLLLDGALRERKGIFA